MDRLCEYNQGAAWLEPSYSCAQFWIHSLDTSPPFTPLLGIAGDLLTAIIQTNINDVTTSTLDVSFPIHPSFTLPMVSGPKHSQHDDEYEISTTPKQGQTPFSPPPAAAQVPLQECRRGKNVINVKAGFLPKVFSNFHTGLDLIIPSLGVLHCKV